MTIDALDSKATRVPHAGARARPRLRAGRRCVGTVPGLAPRLAVDPAGSPARSPPWWRSSC